MTKKNEMKKADNFRDAPPILVRLTKESRDKLEKIAEKKLWSLSQLGSVAIDEYLARHAPK